MIFKAGNFKDKNSLIFRVFVSKLIEIFIISFLIFLLWNKMLTLDRFIKYLIIILFILLYLFVIDVIKLILVNTWFEKNKKKYDSQKDTVEKQKIVQKLSDDFNKLLNIYIYMNPILSLFIYYFENQLYYFRWINYKLGDLLILKYIHFYFIYTLYILIVYPIMLIFWFYYKIIKRWKEYNLTELLFRRTEGLILSILIFTDLYRWIYDYINQYNMYLMVYLILIVTAQLIFIYNKILFKRFEKHYQIFHIRFSINIIIEYKRNESTILGGLLRNIIELLKKEDKNKLYFSNYFNYDYHYTSIENFRKACIILFNIDQNFLIEEKYKPSYSYYRKLVYVFNDIDTHNEWLYLNRLRRRENIEMYKEYYNYKLECIKKKFFLIWSLENYSGIENVYIEWWEYSNNNYCTGYFNLEEKDVNIKKLFIIKNKETFLDISEDREVLYGLLQECSIETKTAFKYIHIVKVNELEKVDDQYSRELLLQYRNEYEEWYKNIREEWKKLKEQKGIKELLKTLKLEKNENKFYTDENDLNI